MNYIGLVFELTVEFNIRNFLHICLLIIVLYIVLDRRSEVRVCLSKDDGEQELVLETEKAMMEEYRGDSHSWEKLKNEIGKLKQQYRDQHTAKCYQLKIHQKKDDNIDEVIQEIDKRGTQPVLNNIELIKDQWRTLDLWETLQLVNPSPLVNFDREELFQRDETSLETKADTTLMRSITLCCIFENLMRSLGWKVGDTFDIEEDICDVVGKLMMKVEAPDRINILHVMQSAMMNIQTQWIEQGGTKLRSEQDSTKLRSLLINKKKYNGLNLACILLEQMILDNKDNNSSWMKTVCAEFIDLIIQLIIEPVYREDIHCTFNIFAKLKPRWSDLYNLIKNGLLLFRYRHDYFHRHLMMIRNLAVPPSSNIFLWKGSKTFLYCRDENNLKFINFEMYEEEEEKSLEQVLSEMKEGVVEHAEKEWIRTIVKQSQSRLREYENNYEGGIVRELKLIQNSKQKDDMTSSCLTVTSMALYLWKQFRPLNIQLVSYCLLIVQNKKGRLLEILTGEGKSCVIAMVAATYALMGRTVDIVTSSPVLSQRDAEEWRKFYAKMNLAAACNVDAPNKGDNCSCYECHIVNKRHDSNSYTCPIVYGTVETFARDILRTEFFMHDVRKGRKCDIVLVDEVDSMLIDQGVQCTYLSHDVGGIWMRHYEQILSLIWMNVQTFTPVVFDKGEIFYVSEQEVFFMTLCRLKKDIDPLQIVRLAEEDRGNGIEKGFTNEYLSRNIKRQELLLDLLQGDEVKRFFLFARKILHLDINIYDDINDMKQFISVCVQQNVNIRSQISILISDGGLASVCLHEDTVKDRLTKMITACISSDENGTKINLPIHLRDYCVSRLRYWIDNAFLAFKMLPRREYIVEDTAVYPVDYTSTGVVETHKKWSDGLQQFLEMKHHLSRSPLSLITNFLSNIDFFERYGSNIVGVSGTLGNDAEKKFMRDTFSVEFATIPTSKRRKLFELDGLILNDENEWLFALSYKVESVVVSQRAVLVICEDIATADEIHEHISTRNSEATFYRHTKSDGSDKVRTKKELAPKNVVIATNLGARGTDFVTDDVVNKNGGLFVVVTFLPLNDRVEKQAFGRTGRRGATGSCQIIVNRETMPEWARQCETVDEVERLRDSIEMHRLNNMTEVNLMRNKQELFREYCEMRRNCVKSSPEFTNDLKIQEEILDEKWAKWIQDVETRAHEWNQVELMEELRQNIVDCSNRAKRFESDNIYHIMKFGAVRLMNGDFKGATEFYDRVISMDPAWSAFAYYNRAYCTIQSKDDGYIGRAIDDLKTTSCKLEAIKREILFSEININASILSVDYETGRNKLLDIRTDTATSISQLYYKTMECQLLNHIDTQILETIEKLETIDIMNGCVRRNILDLIRDADCRTERMLQEYQQLGLLFTYNIDKEPQFCYKTQIAFSLVMLETVADTILLAFLRGKLVSGHNIELKNMLDAACCMKATGDESLGWMSRCVSKAIIIGINSVNFIRDVSSLVPIEQNKLESSCKMTRETSQFTHFSNLQARYILELLDSLKQRMNELVSWQDDEILHMTNVTMDALQENIEQTIHEKIKPGQNLYHALCCLYSSVSSSFRSDLLQQYIDLICGIAQFSAYSSQLSYTNSQTAGLQNIADLILLNIPDITAAAAKIEIGYVINEFCHFLYDMLNMFSQKSKADVFDDVQIFEATNKVLTCAWSDVIRGMFKYMIIRSVMLDIQKRTETLFASIFNDADNTEILNDIILFYNWRERKKEWFASISGTLTFMKQRKKRNTKQHKPFSDMSSRLREFNNQMKKKTRSPHAPSQTDVIMISKQKKHNIIILDIDKEANLTISSHNIHESIKLIYNPPCSEYPGGHYVAYVKGGVKLDDDHNYFINYENHIMLCSAIHVALGRNYVLLRLEEIVKVSYTKGVFEGPTSLNFWCVLDDDVEWESQQPVENCIDEFVYEYIDKCVHEYIDEHPSDAGLLFTSENYVCQLKRGCALLRLDMIHQTGQMNQCVNGEMDSSHLYSCIEQALESENVSRLAKFLAEYGSESRSAGVSKSERGTELTSLVSRDACKLFLSSGSFVEAEVYRKHIVERINEGDITTALKLCCIGHQIQFGRNMMNINRPISDVQTLRDTFDRMLKIESYEQERFKYLSITDEWYRVLEPRRLMNIEQRELLREWISTRQYANTEDPIVSLVIEKCLEPKKEDEEKKWQEAKKIREEEREEKERKIREARKTSKEEWEEAVKKRLEAFEMREAEKKRKMRMERKQFELDFTDGDDGDDNDSDNF